MPARRRPPLLEPLVFVVGASSLGAEIAAARLLAPYFGSSTIVWANTIATVLLALSIGYRVGGRLADRRPRLPALGALVLAAAAGLALVPFVSRPLLLAAISALDSISAGAFVASLLGVSGLVAIPVLLLGAVSPFAVRLAVSSVEESGRIAGRLYAISTVGSLAGVFLAAFLLIPALGTRRTFLCFALALAVVAAVALGRRAAVVAPLVVVALIALPVGTLKAPQDGSRLLAEADTEYQYARVLEDSDGTRRLELNEGQAVHSLRRPGSYLTDNYWDDFLALPLAVAGRVPRDVAILGNAGGTTARAYGHFLPATSVDAVEIDPRLTGIARRWFDMRGPRLRTRTADARAFLRETDRRYDAIFVDAYRQPYIPFHLATREFFALCRARLRPGGTLVVNVGHPEGSDRLERVLSSTIGSEFRTVLRDPVAPTNSLVLASGAPASAARVTESRRALPAALWPTAAGVASRLEPGMGGSDVYTDDRAPVEWLIDASLASYAAGSR